MRKIGISLMLMLLSVPWLTLAEPNPLVPVPDDLVVKKITATRVVLTWQLPQAEADDTEVDHFEIKILKDDQVVKNLETADWKKVVRGLDPNTTYRFTVRSIGVDATKSYWTDYELFTTAAPMRFVMLVDMASETLDTIYPGSDIDAVALTRSDGISYAIKVVDANILNGDVGNSHSNPEQALDAPDFFEATDSGYVSMGGPDAFMILRLASSVNAEAQKLKIYEVGSSQGGVDEYVEVYLGETATGPWVKVGEGTGEFSIKL